MRFETVSVSVSVMVWVIEIGEFVIGSFEFGVVDSSNYAQREGLENLQEKRDSKQRNWEWY